MSICRLISAAFVSSLALLSVGGGERVAAQTNGQADASVLLYAHPQAGDIVSDVVFHVIALSGAGIEEKVTRAGGTGTLAIISGDTPDAIQYKGSFRMDGMVAIQDAIGEYRDHGRTSCLLQPGPPKCQVSTDASGSFFNPTFWGEPTGELKSGMSWTVELKQPWEFGPPGKQTVSVLLVDAVNGALTLKREGEGEGTYAGASNTALIKKNGKQYRVSIKRGRSHWAGQAVFRHGVVVSDELLCETAVELSSPEIGTIAGRERKYMSVVQHPGRIPF
jgi:hypothetical protein